MSEGWQERPEGDKNQMPGTEKAGTTKKRAKGTEEEEAMPPPKTFRIQDLQATVNNLVLKALAAVGPHSGASSSKASGNSAVVPATPAGKGEVAPGMAKSGLKKVVESIQSAVGVAGQVVAVQASGSGGE